MSFLDKLTGNKQPPTGIELRNKVVGSNNQFNIHPDIQGLLWFVDGPQKNYTPTPVSNRNIFICEGIRIEVILYGAIEPSCISLKQPVTFVNDISSVERPPYFPVYNDITPIQRGIYWRLLKDPYDNTIDIGYVFILYYGLERHLLEGNFEKAFDVILKLRDVHRNNSFQKYSACALILACITRQRPDYVLKFINSLDKDYEFNFDSDLFLLCKYSLNLVLSANDIIRLAKAFEFTNTNYLKKYPDIFEDNLRECMCNAIHAECLNIKQHISQSDFRRLRKQDVSMFANISLIKDPIAIPVILDSFKFKRIVNDLLTNAHEITKAQIAVMRKEGSLPHLENDDKQVRTISAPLAFDSAYEYQLLNEIKKNERQPVDRHFAYIAIQEFYYKYRALGEVYIQKCIEYSIKDLRSLNEVQQCHYQEELSRIRKLSSIYGSAKTNEEIRKIQPFVGNIPAFNRLTIIYEKKKDFVSARAVCNDAIAYYSSIGMANAVSEFVERRSKIDAKAMKG